MYLRDRVPEIVSLSGVTFVLKDLVYISRWLLLIQQPLLTQYSPSTHSVIFWICVSVRRFERFEFLSEKINFAPLAAQNCPPSNQIPVTHNTKGFQVWSCHKAPPGGQEVQNVSF